MSTFPCLVRSVSPSGDVRFALGDPLIDRFLAFVAGRSRAETLRATAFDLKTFFMVIDKAPIEVTGADVFDFLAHQRGDRSVVRMSDRESGLSARTIARRLSSVSGFYAYVVARDDTSVVSNPVPRGLSTRRQGGSKRSQMAPLVRVPRTLPTILSPAEADALMAALRTHRDRAMILAMLLGGLRRCEVLGLGLKDLWAGEHRVFIANGKVLRQRDHARDHNQPDRAALFDRIIAKAENTLLTTITRVTPALCAVLRPLQACSRLARANILRSPIRCARSAREQLSKAAPIGKICG